MKASYGQPLDATTQDERGWTETDYWAAFQESCTYDDLGYITSVTPIPYHPKEYREVWGVWGVRSGKSASFASFSTVYEAVCGGHEEWVQPGRRALCFQIAQDLRLAQEALHGIRALLEKIPFLQRAYTYRGKQHASRILNITAQRVDLWNGMVIAVIPPNPRSIRGYDSPIATLDEVAVWKQDADAANPDFEIYSQVSSRQAQFEHPKIIGISSPWNKGGILYQRYEAGTDGHKLRCTQCRLDEAPSCAHPLKERERHQNRLILHGTTAGLANPLVSHAWLQEERAKDPRAFERECLARFHDSLSGFLSSALLQKAVDAGVLERPPEPAFHYIAALDPAFRRDAFGFAIGHVDEARGVVLDLVRRFKPDHGTELNPRDLFDQLTPLLKQYGVVSIYTDQYQFESLNQLANDRGFALSPVRFSATKKASIYGDLKMLLHQGRLRLLDDEEVLSELSSLEQVLTPGRGMQISAPQGGYDDMATVVALIAHHCVWLLPTTAKPVATPNPEKSVWQICQDHLDAKNRRLDDWRDW